MAEVNWQSVASKVQLAAPMLKKLTQREVSAEMIIRALPMLGIDVPADKVVDIMHKVRSGEYGAKNMFELLQNAAFQGEVDLLLSTPDESTEEEGIIEDAIVSRCPNCNFIYMVR